MAKKKSASRKVLKILILIFLIVMAFVYHKQLIRYGYKAWRLQKRLFHKESATGSRIEFPEGYTVNGIT